MPPAGQSEMGYEFVETMVHFGRELMSEAGYYHTVSLFSDPLAMKEMVEKRGMRISALQAHGPLGRPDYHGEYLRLAIRYAERGEVAGTPVGCACGDGVIDWARVIEICRAVPQDIVFSVECGTIDQAQRSLKHLNSLL